MGLGAEGEAKRTGDGWSLPVFAGLVALQMWAAHAVVFFAHEYAHSFVAWALGWKANPLALHYAHPSLKVLLIQLGIDQNVDEVPIFASGHGMQAAAISGAGMILGNAVITFGLSRWLARAAWRRGWAGWTMFAYWVCVASVGNLIDYVPVRIFTDGTDLYQDMYAVEMGLGWTPWRLLVVLGVPVAVVLGYFFVRIEPETLWGLFPESCGRRVSMAVLTALALFDFYGLAGLLGGGPVAARLSWISVCIVGPLAAIGSGFFSGRAKRA